MPILSSMEPQDTPLRAPRRAVFLDHELRHDEQRDALVAFRGALDAGQHQVDDVVRHVVFAGRDEDLLAGDLVGAVGLRDGLGAHQAEIGAAMRLGQVHRAGPFALDHVRQVCLLLLVRSMGGQGRNRTGGQARIHGEGHVCGRGEFVEDRSQRVRQTLSAVIRISGTAFPSPLRKKRRRLP
jgi:hypothetical protein